MIINSTPKISTPVYTGRQKNSDDKPSGIKTRSGNMLMGALIALSSLAPFNPAQAKTDVVKETQTAVMSEPAEEECETFIARFSDTNGILEPSDFNYSSDKAKKLAQSYLDGLKPYMGKPCTQAVSDMADNLTRVFNLSNNYAYDWEADEMVKNADSYIAYDRMGRVLFTKLKYTTGDEETVTYKYFPNGSIDKAVYDNEKVIEYRKDGTRFSLKWNDPFGSKEEIKYDQKGRSIYKSLKKRTHFTEYTFDEQGQVIRHFDKDDRSGCQKIYNNGELALTTFYDGKGRVKSYSDNYFEKEGDDLVVGGYLSRKTVRVGEPYNVLYKQAPLDGKITQPIRQGTTGTCYIAGPVNSLVRIQAGRDLLDKVLPSDYDNSVCEVDFKGFKKKYVIPADAISHNMSRLGRKDADYSGMVMAFEKFRESDMLYDGSVKLPDFFYKDLRGEGDRRVDSGTPMEFFYALTGKIMNHSSGNKITDADIQKAKQCLATGRGIVNLGTVLEEDKNYEIPIADRLNGVVPKHVLSVLAINSNSAVLYDSVTEKEFSYPINKLKKFGSTLYWATVD